MRLSFSLPDIATIKDGIKQLADLVKSADA